MIRAGEFGLPLFHLALFILDIKRELDMWIRKLEVSNRAVYGDRLCGVVRSSPVVRK